MSLSEAERVFFCKWGILYNELVILRKFIYFSMTVKTDDRILKHAQSSQALFFMRILAGKLWEGWQFLQKDFFKSRLSKDYEEKLTDIGKKSLKKLKKYLSRTNNIQKIRNEYAFHYSKEQNKRIEEILPKLSDSEKLDVIISENHLNCFYQASEDIISFIVVQWENYPEDFRNALEKLQDEVGNVTKWFLDFLGDCLKHFVENSGTFELTKIDIPDPPEWKIVNIPYFVKV